MKIVFLIWITIFYFEYTWACTSLVPQVNGNIRFSQSADTGSVVIKVYKTGPPCDFFVTLSRGRSGSFDRKMGKGFETIPYNIYRDGSLSRIIKDLPEANQGEILLGKFFTPGNDSRTFTLTAKVAKQIFQSTGFYVDNINVRVFKGSFSSTVVPQFAQSNIQVSYIQPIAQAISLVESGSTFVAGDNKQSISFYPLREGAVRAFDLLVRSNSGYSVKVESQNGGKLKHDKMDRFINYALELRGHPVRLTQQGLLLAYKGAGSQFQDDRFPLSVRIGQIQKALSGRYTDVIQFTVEAN